MIVNTALRNEMSKVASKAQGLVVNKSDLTYEFIEKALTEYFKGDKQKAMDAVAFIKSQNKGEKEKKEETKEENKLNDVNKEIKVKGDGDGDGDKKDGEKKDGEKKEAEKKNDSVDTTEIEIDLSDDEDTSKKGN